MREIYIHLVCISFCLVLTGVLAIRLAVTLPRIVERNNRLISVMEQKDGYVLETTTEK